MPSVFTLLRDIRKRPEMFVGGDAGDRHGQLRSLEVLLYGYGLAVERHGLDDPGGGFNRSFAAYLRRRFGWSTELGPVVAILDGIPQEMDPWERFWELVDDFQQAPP